MISYREKQLLMVQKYISDQSAQTYANIENVFQNIANKNDVEYVNFDRPHFDNYDELVNYVSSLDGYDMFIRAEDILSAEELSQLEKEYKQIDEEFKSITHLTKTDIGFVFVATAMQIVRQILQPKLNNDILDKSKRGNDKKAASEAKKNGDYDKKLDKQNKKASNDNSKGSRYYHASLSEIVNIGKGVPYDAIKGTKAFDLGMSGNNHRFKTLGHDPYLGYVFGTCNILTDTMTLGGSNLLATYHVKDGIVVAKGDITKVFEHSVKRFEESKATVVAALIKQIYHIKSDELSKKGLSLPFLSLFEDSSKIEQFTDKFDYASVKHVTGTVSKQVALSAMIDLIISVSHTIYMFFSEQKNGISIDSQYSKFIENNDVKEIRTRKVLLYSNLIATTSNVIVCALAGSVGAVTENPKMVDFAKQNLDLGGIVMTIIHLFSDVRFITKVKKEFIKNVIDNNFKQKLEVVQAPSELEELMADFDKKISQNNYC